jgi:hypothetical protein
MKVWHSLQRAGRLGDCLVRETQITEEIAPTGLSDDATLTWEVSVSATHSLLNRFH